MDIQIKFMDGSTYPLKEVSPSITVGELKKQIQGLEEGLAGTCMKLNENGINFSNDLLTLGEVGLQSGASINVFVTMQVFLENTGGKTSTYEVTPGETVTAFKKKVYNKEGVPVDQQRLIYEGKQLEDGRKLKDYNIVCKSTIYRMLRLKGG